MTFEVVSLTESQSATSHALAQKLLDDVDLFVPFHPKTQGTGTTSLLRRACACFLMSRYYERWRPLVAGAGSQRTLVG